MKLHWKQTSQSCIFQTFCLVNSNTYFITLNLPIIFIRSDVFIKKLEFCVWLCVCVCVCVCACVLWMVCVMCVWSYVYVCINVTTNQNNVVITASTIQYPLLANFQKFINWKFKKFVTYTWRKFLPVCLQILLHFLVY